MSWPLSEAATYSISNKGQPFFTEAVRGLADPFVAAGAFGRVVQAGRTKQVAAVEEDREGDDDRDPGEPGESRDRSVGVAAQGDDAGEAEQGEHAGRALGETAQSSRPT